MKRIVAILFTTVTLFTASLFGAGKEIVIGCLQDISGPTSSLGKMVEAGAKWHIDEINAKGGVNGAKIKMITYDTKADVNEAINALTRAITSDKVCAIIGPPIANIVLAIAPISEQYNVPILHLAVDIRSEIKDDGTTYKNTFGMQPNNLQMGAIMGQYAIKNGFKTFGVMYNQSNAYAVSLLEPFTKAVTAAGGTVVKEVAYTANDKDYKTLLSPLVSAKVDAIYMPNYTQDLILITQQARGLGYEGALIAGLDAGPPFNTMLGEDCDKIYYINNVDDTEPKLKDMIKAVKEKAGIDATNKFFLGYDIAGILNQVLAETGPDPDKIHDAMLKVKDYDGLTGKITIDPANHMPTGLEMVMFTYKGTTPVMLERYSAK